MIKKKPIWYTYLNKKCIYKINYNVGLNIKVKFYHVILIFNLRTKIDLLKSLTNTEIELFIIYGHVPSLVGIIFINKCSESLAGKFFCIYSTEGQALATINMRLLANKPGAKSLYCAYELLLRTMIRIRQL